MSIQKNNSFIKKLFNNINIFVEKRKKIKIKNNKIKAK